MKDVFMRAGEHAKLWGGVSSEDEMDSKAGR